MRRTGDRVPDFGAPGAMTEGADVIVPISSGKPCGPWLAGIKSSDRSVWRSPRPGRPPLRLIGAASGGPSSAEPRGRARRGGNGGNHGPEPSHAAVLAVPAPVVAWLP